MFFWLIANSSHARIGAQAGSIGSHGYWRLKIDGRHYRAHRLAWLYEFGHFPAGDIDHKNHNRSDNRIDNLRLATKSQNNANAPLQSNNSTGFKGVSWNKRDKKYIASIKFRGKTVRKSCGTAEEAARIYDYCARRLFGEFAQTNKSLGLLDRSTTTSC
jgi:hypothetical protein